ncbi:hypothetical protein ACHAO3_007489 [Verticillium nonalfalfae]
MKPENIDPARTRRLAKTFKDIVAGHRTVSTATDARLYLEAVRAQPDPSACIETIVASEHGIRGISTSVRTDPSPVFLTAHVVPFLEYLADPGIRAIHEGSLLRQMLLAIVNPPIAWNSLLTLWLDDTLQDGNAEVFAWLSLEIVTLPGQELVSIVESLVAAVEKRSFLHDTNPKVRELGYRIQRALKINSAVESGPIGEAPGGRHDNDCANFRDISVYPTSDEFASSLRPFLRLASVVAQAEPATRPQIHLDNQYRLLREDMLAELKEDIHAVMGKTKGRRRPQVFGMLQPINIDTGTERRAQKSTLLIKCGLGLEMLDKMDSQKRKKLLNDDKKILGHQSFGALCNEKEIIGFAFTVRDVDQLAEKVLGLQFAGNDTLSKALSAFRNPQNLRFVLVNTPVFAYEPVLERLKTIRDMPLEKYLLIENPQTLTDQFDDIQRQVDYLFAEAKRNFIKTKRIVGCTTTAASMHSSLISAFAPDVVMVEEAGEILEAHILAALQPCVQQLILIGDHKQLRPKVNNYTLTVEHGGGFDLNRSLFERLILQGHRHTTLCKQHRMHPDISQLVRQMTYPELLDGDKTSEHPIIRGLLGRVMFINHDKPELDGAGAYSQTDVDYRASKQNPFEAKLVLKLVKYLGQQGYGNSHLVVLTPYLGQLCLLRDELSKENDPLLNDMDSAELIRAGLMTTAASLVAKTKIRLSTIEDEEHRQKEKELQRRAQRNFQLESERLVREASYRAQLQQLDEDIEAERRMLQFEKTSQEQDKTLEQRRADLQALKQTRARREAIVETEQKNEAASVVNLASSSKPKAGSEIENTGAQKEWEGMKRVDHARCKTTVARIYAKFLTSLAIIAGSEFEETTGSKLASMGVTGCQTLIEKVLENGGGVIFIDEAYQLSSGNSPGGRAVLDFLLAEVENLTGMIVFVLAGYTKQMETFFAHNPGFPSRFPLEMKFEDYDDKELLRILERQISKKFGGRMTVEDGLQGLFCRIVARRLGMGRGTEGFGNARAVENAFSRICMRQADRLLSERRKGLRPDDLKLSKEDLIGPQPTNALENSTAWGKLQGLVGLSSVKESVQMLLDTIQANYQREMAEEPVIQFSLNRVFLGSPGTGKTTVAKIYGQILVDLGLLSSGEVIVKNPSDFVGAVMGQSEQQTRGILAATVGKVLVIDEAYGLYGGGGTQGRGATDPYRTAVIDTIVAEVQSTPGDDRCVLLLGYKDPLEEMFQNVNPGLSRRFPLASAFVFEDFDNDDLRKILDLKLKQQGFKATDQAKTVAIEVLDRARNRPNFGNAGEIDILLDQAKGSHQKRLSLGQTKHRVTLGAVDFDAGFERMQRSQTNIPMLFEGTVGCEKIVAILQGYQDIVRTSRLLGMDPKGQVPFNFLFRGPPGTGKTSTAKKMGKVFMDMGLLASADVLDCSATDLIGQYVGQTGPKVQQLLDKALGRVLLIDEAYRLADGQFAKEALDELVDAVTKDKYEGRLVIILAGYENDINRLMSVNPGMTSRFPETIDFYSLDPGSCLELLTRTLQKQKQRLKGTKGDLNLGCFERPSRRFEVDVLRLFDGLSKQTSWASARDIETLAKAVFNVGLRGLKEGGGHCILVSEDVVLGQLQKMLHERHSREKRVSHQLTTGLADLSLLSPPIAEPTLMHQHEERTTETSQQGAKEDDLTPPSSPEPNLRFQNDSIRDAGVSDEVWEQLQKDAQAEGDQEEQYQSMLEAKKTADEGELDRIMGELIGAENRRRQEAEARRKLALSGRCPVGYAWIKQAGGYRCAGGSHFVRDLEMA